MLFFVAVVVGGVVVAVVVVGVVVGVVIFAVVVFWAMVSYGTMTYAKVPPHAVELCSTRPNRKGNPLIRVMIQVLFVI